MQSESPTLYLLYDKIFTTHKTLLECFLKPEYLELTEQEKINSHDETSALETKILNIDFENTENHLPLEDLYLGGNVTALMVLKRNSLELYIESVKQIKYRVPVEDEQRQRMKNLRFLSPDTLLDPNLKHL
nr:unnamed protein product [Callosobruchus analis]